MATVYKAHELSLNRVVALKVLSTQLSADKEYIKRFQREAQAAAQLNHPNIVQVFPSARKKVFITLPWNISKVPVWPISKKISEL